MHGFRNNYLVLYGRGFEGYLNYMLALCVNVFSVKSGCRSLLVFLLIMQMSAFFRNANSFLCSLWLVCPNWEEEKVNKVLKNMRRYAVLAKHVFSMHVVKILANFVRIFLEHYTCVYHFRRLLMVQISAWKLKIKRMENNIIVNYFLKSWFALVQNYLQYHRYM